MTERPSGTVTFLFTDIEGSTRLWHDYQAEMAAAISLHDEVVQTASDRHCGHIFFRAGDGCGIAFNSPYEAVTAATEIQQQLGALVEIHGRPMKVRIGLNTGEAVERDGDYLGTSVNIAARVRDIAHGGEVLLSSATRDLVYRALAPTETLRRLRAHRLKGIDHRERIYRLGRRVLTLRPTPQQVAGVVIGVIVVAGAVWAVDRFDGQGEPVETTTTSEEGATTTEEPAPATESDPTTGLLTIDADTTLNADHQGRIVIGAPGLLLDCDGHRVLDPEPADVDGQPDHLEAGILVYQKDDVTIRDCVVVDHWTGISVIQSERAWVTGNTITHTIPPQRFTVRTGIGLTECGNCAVNANTITEIVGDAIDLYRTVDSEIYDNTVNAPGIAIRVIDSEYNSIRTNSLANREGGPLGGGGIGIALFGRSSNNVIEGNTTRGFLIGIELGHESFNNHVRANRGVFNDHDIAACPALVERNVIDLEDEEEVANVEDLLGDPCS